MSQTAKAQEPSMEEILASIRRIIADDDAAKPPAKAAEPPKPAPAPAPARPAAPAARPAAAPPRPAPPPPAISAQDDIDSMFAMPEPRQNGAGAPADILDLTEAMEAPAEAPVLRRIDALPDVVEAPSPEPDEPPKALR